MPHARSGIGAVMVLATVGLRSRWVEIGKGKTSVSEKKGISDENHEARFGSLMLWFCVAPLAYALSIGPAAWLHEKSTSATLKVRLETIYAPVVLLIQETPLRQAGEWWVGQWVDLPGPK